MDEVLPCEFFILVGFNVRGLTKLNSQQMWMNFNAFSTSSGVNCVIRITFNLDAVCKGWKLLSYINNLNPTNFTLGKFYVIHLHPKCIHSGVNRALNNE